ncbi:nuclear transport factor 2 family protein [Arthrobacter nitrophenolicus]|uniref:Uncharacterized protein n=1 Tax=Arthrobacter nitrophenolicus TaxID=683150 RepID=A0ACC6TL13_9MICC|nr:nuclear transport factor 2 family protein [Arthrobacter nitrophenolicus]
MDNMERGGVDPITRLEAIEGIKLVKARYFRATDTKDYDLLRSVFADDVVFDARGVVTDPVSGFNLAPGTDEVIRGVDNVISSNRAALVDIVSVHHASVPEIEITGPTSGSGIWPMVDLLLFKEGSPFKEIVGYGFYHDTYERIDGQWKIKTVRQERTRLDFIPW